MEIIQTMNWGQDVKGDLFLSPILHRLIACAIGMASLTVNPTSLGASGLAALRKWFSMIGTSEFKDFRTWCWDQVLRFNFFDKLGRPLAAPWTVRDGSIDLVGIPGEFGEYGRALAANMTRQIGALSVGAEAAPTSDPSCSALSSSIVQITVALLDGIPSYVYLTSKGPPTLCELYII